MTTPRQWWPLRYRRHAQPSYVSAAPRLSPDPEAPVTYQRHDDADHQLVEAADLVRKARAAGDTTEVDRLMGWIDQRLDQGLEAGRD
jgi:hypothetical protein